MSHKYTVAVRSIGTYQRDVSADNPKEAFEKAIKTAINNIKLEEVTEQELANICVELQDGERKSVKLYAIHYL